MFHGVVSWGCLIYWFSALTTGVAYWGYYVLSGYWFVFMSGCPSFAGLCCFLAYKLPSLKVFAVVGVGIGEKTIYQCRNESYD